MQTHSPMERRTASRARRLAPRAFVALLAAMLPLAIGARPYAQSSTVSDKPTFKASVTSVQTSLGSNGYHYLAVSVHFLNKTAKPLILGVDRSKISASDDQGNHYAIFETRGIGVVNGSTVDPKFVLPPSGGGDALFELRWSAPAGVVFGVGFDLNLPIREIESLPAKQLRLGNEHAVEFNGLKDGMVAEAAPLPEHTVDAGPFTAQIVRSKPGDAGRWKTVEMTVKLKNTSDKPLILAYEYKSNFGADDQGNRFGFGSIDKSATGIGVVSDGQADPQFVLAPGESKEVRFTVARTHGRESAGTKMTYYVALGQLEILPSQQIREVRQFSLAFPGVPCR